MSMGRDKNLPLAFYKPNRQTTLIRSSSKKSNLSQSSKNGSFKNINLMTNSPMALMKSKVLNVSARKSRQSFSAKKRSKQHDGERDRSARLAADRNEHKFATKLPEKALRQTYKIKQNQPMRNALQTRMADLPSELVTNDEGSAQMASLPAANSSALATQNIKMKTSIDNAAQKSSEPITVDENAHRQMSMTNVQGFKDSTPYLP